MRERRDDSGFSLVEVLVAIGIFGAVTAAFYQVLFAGSGASRTARSVSEVSSEARLGLNRMIRDTRQASTITSATPTSYTIEVDFDGTGSITQAPAQNGGGDYEQLSFLLQNGRMYIEACNVIQGADCGEQKSVLIEGVGPQGTDPVFLYSSNHLEFDWNSDGVATQSEIDAAGSHGYTLTPAQRLSYLSEVRYAMKVTDGKASTVFAAHAQLRSKR